jgi:transposase-like protein
MEKSMTEMMKFSTVGFSDALTEILREGAQRLLSQAIQMEVEAWIVARADQVDAQGHRLVVRNGYLPEREVMTGIGMVPVRQPRVKDRRPVGQREVFDRKILPPYLRRTQSVDEAIPWMYLYGISTNDMGEAMEALLGPSGRGVSASTVSRMTQWWQEEHAQWNKRSLAKKRYVYFWADGVYFNVRMPDERACILVLLGATETGEKEILAITDGYRESEQSWSALLLDVKSRGLTLSPKLATADRALGFWLALEKIYPDTRHQLCWVHKAANVVSKLPDRLGQEANHKLRQIWMAETKAHANKAFDLFVETYEDKYPSAVECLKKDRDRLLTFYDFPAKHWTHIRTSNPIESIFSTVRLRHNKTRNNASRAACLAMIYKLGRVAERGFQRLNGSELLPDVVAGIIYEDGVKKSAA